MATVHLVDASPYVFRAFFSLPTSMTDGEGRPMNAVHGFGSFLCKLWCDEDITHLGVCFDESLTTSFRNELHPGYKASRELPPPELEAQLAACQQLAAALGAACFVSDRFEADDLIATLAPLCTNAGHDVVVVTSDKDLAQLVGPRVSLLDFGKGERLGPAEVEAKLGVPPSKVVDLLALAGDPVDDIPGVRGVGRKTAAALLARFDGIDDIYARLDEVAELPIRGAKSLVTKLRDGEESARLSHRLATCCAESVLGVDDVSVEALRLRGADRATLEPLCERLRLRSLPGRVPRWA